MQKYVYVFMPMVQLDRSFRNSPVKEVSDRKEKIVNNFERDGNLVVQNCI